MNVKMKNICIADNYYYLAIFCLLHICIFNYRWDKHSPGWWLWSLLLLFSLGCYLPRILHQLTKSFPLLKS